MSLSGVPIREWEDPRQVLKRYGLKPKSRFSQNFLVSRHAVERIALELAPNPNELTVELGPGLGTLTGELLRAGANVLAIDRDEDMLRVLGQEYAGVETLECRAGDAATVDFEALAASSGQPGQPVALAGNLPYAITGAILRNVTRHRGSLRRAVLMVQREVQERLTASPGEKVYGALTVFLRAQFDVRVVMHLKAGSFHPPPKVRSSIVRLEPLVVPRAEENESFRAVVKAAFGQRRKTLRNALKQLGDFEDAGIDLKRRGETLSIEELAVLGRFSADR